MPSVELLEYFREAINEVYVQYGQRIYIKRVDPVLTVVDDLYGEATNPVYIKDEDGELPSFIAVVRVALQPKVLDKPMLHEDIDVTVEVPIQQEIDKQFDIKSTDIIMHNDIDYRIDSEIYDRPIMCDDGTTGYLVHALLLKTK